MDILVPLLISTVFVNLLVGTQREVRVEGPGEGAGTRRCIGTVV